MELIGITGPIGHGKTTFAGALLELESPALHLESNMPIIEIASAWQLALPQAFDPHDVTALNEWVRELPNILQDLFGIQTTYEALKIHPETAMAAPIEYEKLLHHAALLVSEPGLALQRITPENKELYRPLLQWLGSYLPPRIDEGMWYREIVRRAKEFEKSGGKLCVSGGIRYPIDAQIWRDAGGTVLKVHRPDKREHDLSDPTERQRNDIVADSVIVNNGTIDDLQRLAPRVLSDIEEGTLKAEYSSRS